MILMALVVVGAVYISYRLSTGQGIVPTAPGSIPRAAGCKEECPGSDGVLRNCTPPEADGSSEDSICTYAGRVAACGGTDFCCPSAGGKWTKDMTKCPTTTPGVECATCTSDINCGTGLKCDTEDGRCKKTDGISVCYSGSTACTVTTTSVCVATATITCSPDCSTECGKAASTISTCTNSCGVATTKSCAATSVCADAISVTKKAYQNDSGNSAGRYTYTTEIDAVSKNQIFVYAIAITNTGAVDATGVTIADTLDGEHQDLLTLMDASAGCSYTPANSLMSCKGLTIKAGQTATFGFRVKVSDGATNGFSVKNVAVVGAGGTTFEASNDLIVSTVVGCNHTCTADSECTTGLSCDSVTSKCRKEACLDADNCVCPQVTAAPTARPTARATATQPAAAQPTEFVETPITVAPTVYVAAAQPTVLPDAGILDFPGVAAFGGGLLLAVIGILLAL